MHISRMNERQLIGAVYVGVIDIVDHLLLHCDAAYVLWSEIFYDIWGLVGNLVDSDRSIIWRVELVWEAPFQCLESYSVMFDVDGVEGKEQLHP